MSFSPDPIPEAVLASWTTADGKQHQQVVEVAGRIPDIANFTGIIVYKFTDKGVVISPVRRAVADRNQRLGKITVP